MSITASIQHPKTCPSCGMALVFPEWSESADGEKTIHIWLCLGCGNEFETTDGSIKEKPSDTELVQMFLPNLLVA
jgi:Zn ribbon nucleic-acid-binding protein